MRAVKQRRVLEYLCVKYMPLMHFLTTRRLTSLPGDSSVNRAHPCHVLTGRYSYWIDDTKEVVFVGRAGQLSFKKSRWGDLITFDRQLRGI